MELIGSWTVVKRNRKKITGYWEGAAGTNYGEEAGLFEINKKGKHKIFDLTINRRGNPIKGDLLYINSARQSKSLGWSKNSLASMQNETGLLIKGDDCTITFYPDAETGDVPQRVISDASGAMLNSVTELSNVYPTDAYYGELANLFDGDSDPLGQVTLQPTQAVQQFC